MDLLGGGLDLALDDGLEHHVAVDLDADEQLEAVGALADGPQPFVGDAHGRARPVPEAVLEVDEGVGGLDVGVEDGVGHLVAHREDLRLRAAADGARLDVGGHLVGLAGVAGEVLVLAVAAGGLEVGLVVVEDLDGALLGDARGDGTGVGDLEATCGGLLSVYVSCGAHDMAWGYGLGLCWLTHFFC